MQINLSKNGLINPKISLSNFHQILINGKYWWPKPCLGACSSSFFLSNSTEFTGMVSKSIKHLPLVKQNFKTSCRDLQIIKGYFLNALQKTQLTFTVVVLNKPYPLIQILNKILVALIPLHCCEVMSNKLDIWPPCFTEGLD